MTTKDTDTPSEATTATEHAPGKDKPLPADAGESAAETPTAPSTLDELPSSARKQDRMRLKKAAEAEERTDTSTMEELTTSSKSAGNRTSLEPIAAEPTSLPPSALEQLLRVTPQGNQSSARSGRERAPLGDPSTHAPRMSLTPVEKEVREVARLEGLLAFEHPLSVGQAAGSARGASSLEGLLGVRTGPMDLGIPGKLPPRGSSMVGADTHVGGSPMRLRRKVTSSRPVLSTDLSKLVGDQPLPRARLPRRTTSGTIPDPDGFTPIPPQPVAIHCTLAAHQRCPGKKKPVEIGTRVHQRLEFRYNRFELLEITQVLYECPDVEDMMPFAGANPAWLASHAPIGNGMLAQLVVSIFRDGLPLNRVETLLSQLSAPIARSVLQGQLIEAADALAPIVAHLRAGQHKATVSPPVPVLQAGPQRDAISHLVVYTDKTAIVAQLCDGSPSTVGESGAAVQLRDTAKSQGRAARWGMLRQKFFYALVTDNTQARRALRLLEQLPSVPDPEKNTRQLARLKQWLDDAHQTITVPKSRLEHAVTFGVSMWELLTGAEPVRHRQTGAVSEWSFDVGSVPAEQTMVFHSILETCALLDVTPWEYLMDLFTRLGGPDIDVSAWTPAAWKQTRG